MTGNEIRSAFIKFFETKGHKKMRSSSLVPINDPTILFTNAGMNQFKDYFLGNETPECTRVVTAQKVLRAGGKHNDLENVGRTDRHHTFFEMLGNFSFGDYFKQDAIAYAWEFLTETLGLDKDKLAVSVYKDDQESFDIWHNEIGVPEDKIAKLGEKDNFWSMGDTGPCGPCSEIHFQLHPFKNGKTTIQSLEDDDGTYLEVWNLVFMQFNQEKDGARTALPKPSIDTGMGLERIASVVQGHDSNYGCDLFHDLLKKIAYKADYSLGERSEKDVSCRVIADHLRAAVFLIADNVVPGNEGRAYVLRRIIRRAARHGKELGFSPGFFAGLVSDFVPMMEDAYPEIRVNMNFVHIILEQEEQRFNTTLGHGMKILDTIIEETRSSKKTLVQGQKIFELYDTYGFPADLAGDILQDRGLDYDHASFADAMEEQKNRARSAQDTRGIDLKVEAIYMQLLEEGIQNRFIGYADLEKKAAIKAILVNGERVGCLNMGDKVEVVLEETPFYAESGGQVGDKGEIIHDEFRIRIDETKSPVAGLNLSKGEIIFIEDGNQVQLQMGTLVNSRVNEASRKATECNHTATHLLHAALQTVLGEHVKQAGSLVNDSKLRFDFSHYAPLTREQLSDVESLVCTWIQNNAQVTAEEMSFSEAVDTGAMAIFGEKYGERVRVVTAGETSKELCGGCHTSRNGNIGLFKIVFEQGIAAGIRRIEAVTGSVAIDWVQNNMLILNQLSQSLKTTPAELVQRLDQLMDQSKETAKEMARIQKEIKKGEAKQAMSQVRQIGSIPVLILKVDEDTDLKEHVIVLQQQMEQGVILLGKEINNEKIALLLSVSKDLNPGLHAGNIIRDLAPLISGRGGGKPDLAQCGGTNVKGWSEVTKELEKILSVC